MITLETNLHDAILFAMMDSKKYSQQQCHDVARTIAPQINKEVRRLFKFFIKGHFRHEQNPEIRNAIKEFIKMSIDEEVSK
jgi:thymidylate synthase ThyX